MTALSVPPDQQSPFEKVMQEHTPRVIRSLRYLGVSEADLPDASQEVFLVVHRRLHEFRGEASLSTWIYEICFRLARAWRRRAAARRDAPVAELPTVGTDATQESALQVARARHRLLQMLDELPEEQRAVVVLHELEELKMADVASLLNCPLFTAYSRLRLARKRLEQLLTRADSEVEHG
jgi:RNA polymerase sigma-70 factor, ECF subfamily